MENPACRAADRREGAIPPGPPRHPQRLARRQRLRETRFFEEAFAQGEIFSGRLVVMRVRRGPGAALRLGVVAGRRAFPRAVDRSRAKRLLREAFRLNRGCLAGECDLVLTARASMRGASCRDVERDLMTLARRAGLMEMSS